MSPRPPSSPPTDTLQPCPPPLPYPPPAPPPPPPCRTSLRPSPSRSPSPACSPPPPSSRRSAPDSTGGVATQRTRSRRSGVGERRLDRQRRPLGGVERQDPSGVADVGADPPEGRSAERRVGKGCVHACSIRGCPEQ